ncbi:dehydrogenase/reductase [Amylocarpus encephaloides]|uniref:Dehydrogenase/reductase n=1 Tax=Amylocarpus encephaloides TaxID=45428 RepID=A0A9P7Y7C3_9HELO|nr:dehydrogenase/reductase [Amylocarpus encephaloides]
MSYTHTVLITGGTINLGYHAALTIARLCPKHLIILSSRSDRLSAAQKINTTLKQSNVIFIPIDLGSLTSVREFAKSYAVANHPPLIALVANAGLQFPFEINYTTDGYESTFGVNHVGHALLLHLLTPFMVPETRITFTASGTHDPAQSAMGFPIANYTNPEDLAHPSPASIAAIKDGRVRYSTSKLINVLFSNALARHITSLKTSHSKIVVNSFDPGLLPGTELGREYTSRLLKFAWYQVLPRIIPLLRLLVNKNIHSPAESGEALGLLAVGGKSYEGKSGRYYEGKMEIPSSVDSYDEKKQEEVWEWTMKTCTEGGKESDYLMFGAR